MTDSPMAGQARRAAEAGNDSLLSEVLLELAQEPMELLSFEQDVTGWAETARQAVTARVLTWLREPDSTVHLSCAARLCVAMRLRHAGPDLLERLRMGPPSVDVVAAVGSLQVTEALPVLREIARSEPTLRHAALVSMVRLDPSGGAALLKEEYKTASDLINTTPAHRGDPANHGTFDTLVEMLHHLNGPVALVEVAKELHGQNPGKNRLLAEYLVAVIESPLLPAPELLPGLPDAATCKRHIRQILL